MYNSPILRTYILYVRSLRVCCTCSASTGMARKMCIILCILCIVTFFFLFSSLLFSVFACAGARNLLKTIFFWWEIFVRKARARRCFGRQKDVRRTMVVSINDFCRVVLFSCTYKTALCYNLANTRRVRVWVRCGCVLRECVTRRNRVPCTCVNNGPREDDDVGPAETCHYIIYNNII